MIKNTSRRKIRDRIKHTFTTTNVLFIVAFVFLALFVSLFLYLLYWGFITSFKDNYNDFVRNVLGLPKKWRFSNYAESFKAIKVRIASGSGVRYAFFPELLLNSVLYAVGGALVLVCSACFTAYCVAKFDKCKFSKILYAFNIVTMILPIVGSGPSTLQIMRALHIYDTIIGFWITKAHFMGLNFLLFHAAFTKLAQEYSEAAELDGASNFGVFFRIVLPLISGIFLTIFLIEFVAIWNDYQTPLVYMPTHPPLSTGVFEFSRSSTNATVGTPHKIAGCMILFLPIFIFFLIFHGRLMNNLSMGGIKE